MRLMKAECNDGRIIVLEWRDKSEATASGRKKRRRKANAKENMDNRNPE